MNDRDFMRYSRQILLDDIALDGQQKLLDSQVLIIGLGGLGTPAALYLAGAGVGTLVLADDDDVHLSNLQRQILFTTEDIDRPKSQVSQQRLTQLNPDIQLTALQQRLTGEALKDAVARYAEEAMQILFNDQPMQCAAGQTVHELLEQLDQRQAGAALAINQQIVPREQWAQHIVQDGDQILLFQVIAGG